MHQAVTSPSIDLQHAADRFAEWRRNKATKQSRIPEELWNLACRAAIAHGVCKTSTTLKLDYGRLKRRVEGETSGAGRSNDQSQQQQGRTPAGFVEVAPTLAGGATECELEWSSGCGARLVLRWKGTIAPDFALLGQLFHQR